MNSQKTTKLLVTGLSGMVGSRFAELYSNKYQMVNLDLKSGIDITNEKNVDDVFADNRDAVGVIHLAAFTNLNAANEQNGDKTGICYQVNVTGTKTMAQASQKYRMHMVHISTDYVFDGDKTESYTEEDVTHPIEWYGQTKLLAEQAVIESGTSNTILRLAFPYQADPIRPDLIAKMRQAFESHALYPLFSDHYLTPTFVDDVASVFDYVVDHRPEGIYHMTGSSSHSDFEIGQMVKQVFGYDDEVKPGLLSEYLAKNPRPYQRSLRIDNSKLQKEFGIKMRTLEEGLNIIHRQQE